MGMSASQARLLGLQARQSNLEYQGQQINQERTILSQQCTALYNSLLAMQVPTPPSTQDYTTIEYSGVDGATNFTLGTVKPSGENYNVEIKTNQTMFEDVRYSQMISGEEISLKQLTGGRNVIDVVLSESVDAEHTLFAALYDKGRLVTMLSPTQSTQNEYSFEVQMNGNENYHLKLFL